MQIKWIYWSAEPSPLHAWLLYVYSMAHCVCLFNIRCIQELYAYLAPEQGSGTESVHDLRVGGMHLAMSLTELRTWKPLPVYTVTSIDNWPAKHRVAISRVHVHVHVGARLVTATHYYKCTFSQTTLTIQHWRVGTDGQTKIAFAARVNIVRLVTVVATLDWWL